MFNYPEKTFDAETEVAFDDIGEIFQILQTSSFEEVQPLEKSKFMVGFAIALPISLAMWVGVVGIVYMLCTRNFG